MNLPEKITTYRLEILFAAFYISASLFVLMHFDGTGDSADSITHYLFARYAPEQPELFFNHWAKPVFVMLSSPLAQLGFGGMKLFNVFINLITLLLILQIAKGLKLKYPFIAGLAALCSPWFFKLGFSGLTEPLFASALAFALFLVEKKHLKTAAIIASFLPFIRSEGLIFLPVFALYFLFNKRYLSVILLSFGHLAISIAGMSFHEGIFWVFTEIPYAHLNSTYGHGDYLHFVRQLLYVTGIPIYVLLCAGLLHSGYILLKRKFNKELHILYLGGFLAFFIAHTLFWALGIFNSMGLLRVFIAVIPCIAILAASGCEQICNIIPRFRSQLAGIIAGCMLVFPFTKNHAALNFEKDFSLTHDQLVVSEFSKYIRQNYSLHKFTLIYSHPYLSYCLGINHFNPAQHQDPMGKFPGNIEPGCLFIWDIWFTEIHHGIRLADVEQHSDFERVIGSSELTNHPNDELVLYKRKAQ